ncbi:MAG: ABC transporter ATP-binding protein [Sporolactobacillus sp.]
MSSTNKREAWGVSKLRLAFPKQPAMQFKDLSFHYNPGEKILLLGPSGCGKSTLLQVLSGLIPESVPMPVKAEKQQIPPNWGFIFQDPESQFCMPYADEDLAFVLENRQIARSQMPERIDHYLNLTGLHFSDPHQLIHKFSGGMKQRLAIAGVLALEADVLFLDEPTALLDSEGTQAFWKTIQGIQADRTLIIVEHKIEQVIDFVDRIVLFNPDGEIIADGARDQVLEQHKKELILYGIWYPGAWADFIKKQPPSIRSPQKVQQLLALDHFEVKRHGQIKCSVDHLTVNEGEWVAITGKNGAGKSTLIEGLIGLLKSKGKLHWSLERPTEEIAFVFQNPEFQFVTDRVDDELAFGLRLRKIDPLSIKERVEKALKRFSLEHVRDHHPYQLSVGQKRRLSVATALIERPKVLILDEPTFGQDAQNTFRLVRLFLELQQQGTTVLMVTHEQEIVRHFATRVLTISHGKLIADRRRMADEDREGGGLGADWNSEDTNMVF